MCVGNAVFFHTEVVSESKIVREMLCFTIETAVRQCEGRKCETAVADMVAYARLCSPMLAHARLCSPMLASCRIGPPLGSASAGG